MAGKGYRRLKEIETMENEKSLTKSQLIEENASLKAALEAATAPKAKTFTRRVYVDHKMYGTCVTIGAHIYLAPAGIAFDKKVTVKMQFSQVGDVVRDSEGREWLCGGENGGCGPRLPKALKAQYPNWAKMSFIDRAQVLKALAPAPAPAAEAVSETVSA